MTNRSQVPTGSVASQSSRGNRWLALRAAVETAASSARARKCALLLALLVLTTLSGFAAKVITDFYTGRTPPALDTSLTATCLPEGSSCEIYQQDLGYGRHGLSIDGLETQGAVLRITVTDEESPTSARLMLKIGGDAYFSRTGVTQADVFVHGPDGELLGRFEAQAGPSHRAGHRHVLPVESTEPVRELTLRLAPTVPSEGPTNLILGEIGLFTHDSEERPLTRDGADPYWVWPRHLYFWTIAVMLLSLPLLQPRQRLWVGALFVLLIALVLLFSALNSYYSPFYSLDARSASALAARAPQFMNLTYGLSMAWNVLEGRGPLVDSRPPFHRMPGYAYLLAFGGLFVPPDKFSVALSVFLTQVLFNAVALTLLYLALARYATPLKSVVICLLIASLPNQIYYTQIDTIIVGAYCLTAAALLALLNEQRTTRGPSLRHHLAVHAAFAVWLSLRPDVLPGWAAVSLLLCWPRGQRRYLFLPIVLAALICVPWGLFKMQFTGEFSPTTSSVGWSLLGGIGEVPNKFGWEASDGLINQWLSAQGFTPPLGHISQAASDFATREAVRFWFTYPGYTLSLVWHKLSAYFNHVALAATDPGLLDWPVVGFSYTRLVAAGRTSLFIGPLAALLALSLALRFRARDTLLMGWAFFFNLPTFFLVFWSTGRFLAGATASLVLAGAVLALDRKLYVAVWSQRRLAGAVLAAVLAFLLFGEQVDRWLLSWDEFRYATPFLDPEASALATFRAPH